MDRVALDEVDRGILRLLQEDARNNTATAIAEEVDVTPTTVGNRIGRLEDAGVIRGYRPHIDYERAGFPLHLLFVCTVSRDERDDVVELVLEIGEVVGVRELVTDRRNLHVEVVARSAEEVGATTDDLCDLGLDVVTVDVVRARTVESWNPAAGGGADSGDGASGDGNGG